MDYDGVAREKICGKILRDLKVIIKSLFIIVIDMGS